MRARRPVSIWIFGDQLDENHPGLADRDPAATCVLMIESEALLTSRRFHRQRLHLVLAAMRRYAEALRARGFAVDYRRTASFAAGLAQHRKQHQPREVLAAEPMSRGMHHMLEKLGVRLLRHERFLCHYRDFERWARGERTLRMDHFYRMRRNASGYLMKDGTFAGGALSFDKDNRKPPPRGSARWPEPVRDTLDALDHEVLAELPANVFGAAPSGVWATTRAAALQRLDYFIERVLPRFGPHQDAMLHSAWQMAHSLLSPYLNIGLLHPREVCDAAQRAYDAGAAPLASVEGFVRQVLGWREYIWGCYWLFGAEYGDSNALGAQRKLLPLYGEPSRTQMRCVRDALDSVEAHGYAHHIQRLMVLGNLALLAGVDPRALTDWMQVSFIDGAEWVMWPNVLGMALFADGGRMSTKPYAAGGAYIHRMSDACGRCPYDPKQRTGPKACPFSTLYWDFHARHEARLQKNPRLRPVLLGLHKLSDRRATREHAVTVLTGLERGEL
jgi:deoxyribodipyrimidine photolyase-related protein